MPSAWADRRNQQAELIHTISEWQIVLPPVAGRRWLNTLFDGAVGVDYVFTAQVYLLINAVYGDVILLRTGSQRPWL